MTPPATTTTTFDYIGDELSLFENARNWKAYFARSLKGYIRGDVAEVGAGLGGTTSTLCTGGEKSWTCLEPDPAMCATISGKVGAGSLPASVRVRNATLASLDENETFDSIIYIDVLEHIENDLQEVACAASRLRPGGHLTVLAPAHQWLFTPFDTAIGHYRRYDKKMLQALTPGQCTVEASFYLDCVGLLASTANKLILKQSKPQVSQILTWDRLMVPLSTLIDPVIGNAAGKTVVMVWRKEP